LVRECGDRIDLIGETDVIARQVGLGVREGNDQVCGVITGECSMEEVDALLGWRRQAFQRADLTGELAE
jgi:hypothetical protein